jgi:hypothetical protein
MSENMQHILNIKINSSDLNQMVDIRTYLKTLLKTLWAEGEGFSGKRPFGNGGWQYEIYRALVKAKACPGKIDDDGYLCDVDTDKADKLILQAIEALA